MRYAADSPQWMAFTVSPDGLITSLSCAVEQLTGYATKELAGRSLGLVLADRSIFQVNQILDTARYLGAWQGQVFHRARNGKAFAARGRVSLLNGAGDADAGFLLVSFLEPPQPIDSDDEALRGVGAQLRALAHEMNNPLAVMMGFAQLIMLDTQCNGKLRSDMEKLYSELNRVVQIVEKLHGFAVTLQQKAPGENLCPAGIPPIS